MEYNCKCWVIKNTSLHVSVRGCQHRLHEYCIQCIIKASNILFFFQHLKYAIQPTETEFRFYNFRNNSFFIYIHVHMYSTGTVAQISSKIFKCAILSIHNCLCYVQMAFLPLFEDKTFLVPSFPQIQCCFYLFPLSGHSWNNGCKIDEGGRGKVKIVLCKQKII